MDLMFKINKAKMDLLLYHVKVKWCNLIRWSKFCKINNNNNNNNNKH